MGQKVTPIGFRLGITYKSQSQWFVDPRSGFMKKIYPPLILEDKFIRDFITQKFPRTAIAQILIFRTLDYIKIEIHTAQAKKISYQPTAFSSQKTLSKESRSDQNSTVNNSTEKNSAEHKVNREKSMMGQSEHNENIKNNSSSSNLKNLQQDLQIALLKYKKTLQVFSTWKHDSYVMQSNKTGNQKYENQTQELPKLWSYETESSPNETKGFDNLLSRDSISLSTESTNVSTTDQKLEMQIKEESATRADAKDNYDTELSFLEEKNKVTQPIGIIVKQVNQPFQYASIFAKYLVSQLERRENSVKQALNRSLKLIQNYNIQGIKIKVSGRLNGVDMAEQENILKGRIPLSTIDANIDYYQDTAQTLYGTLGVKVFIFR